MKIFFKESFILIISITCALLIVFNARKFIYPYIVQDENEMFKNALTNLFPGYNFDKVTTIEIDNKKFNYISGITNIDGAQKVFFVFTSTVPGYYCDLKLTAGVDEGNRISGVYLVRCAGALSSCTDNHGVITDVSSWGFLKYKDFPDHGTADPVFLDQLKRIDYNRKIKIINTGTGINVPAGEPASLNAIYTTANNVSAVIRITDKLKNFLSANNYVRSVFPGNTLEVK